MFQVDLWLGYCAFHMGDYKRAMLEYEALTHAKTPPKVKSEDFHCERYFQSVWINLACCYFYLGMYRCSRVCFCFLFVIFFNLSCYLSFNKNIIFLQTVEDFFSSAMPRRWLKRRRSRDWRRGSNSTFRTSSSSSEYLETGVTWFCRFGDEKKLMQFHQELEDVIEDQLSLGKTTNTVLDKHNDGDDQGGEWWYCHQSIQWLIFLSIHPLPKITLSRGNWHLQADFAG